MYRSYNLQDQDEALSLTEKHFFKFYLLPINGLFKVNTFQLTEAISGGTHDSVESITNLVLKCFHLRTKENKQDLVWGNSPICQDCVILYFKLTLYG